MTNFIYNKLPIQHRAEIIWNRGKFVQAVESEDYDIALYKVDGRYVEVFYSIDNNDLHDIKMLANESRLSAYLKSEKSLEAA
jgi:hypothetical protein